MSFDWHQYLDLARELEKRKQMASTEEARLRSAVSRAYYAAYHAARKRLVQDGDTGIRSAPKPHEYVWKQFRLSPELQRQEIGTKGSRLKLRRFDADYESAVANWQAMTCLAILDSESVFEELAKLP